MDHPTRDDLTETLLSQLKCSICKDTYQDPKVLSCLHIFCRACIQGIVDDGFYMGEVHCPCCDTMAPVEDNDAHSLPTVVFINRLTKYCSALKRAEGSKGGGGDINCEKCLKAKATALCQTISGSDATFVCATCAEMKTSSSDESDLDHELQIIPLSELKHGLLLNEQALQFPIYRCSNHNGAQRKLYCFQCSQLICEGCTSSEHAGHKYDTVKTIANAFKEEVLTSLSPLRDLYSGIKKTVADIEREEIEIAEQGEEISEQLTSSFDQLLAIIEERKQVLLKHTKDTVERKIEVLQRQQVELQDTTKRLETYVGFVEKTSENVCSEEFIAMKKNNITTEIRHLVERFKVVELEPREVADLKVVTPSVDKVVDICQQSSVFSVHAQTYATKQASTGQINKLTVGIVDADSVAKHSVSAELKSLVDGSTVHAEIIPRPSFTYELSYIPRIRARHRLSVCVNDIEVTNHHVFVHHPPTFLGHPVRVIENVHTPRRLAISNTGEIYVTERESNRYAVFDENDKRIKSVSSYSSRTSRQLIGIAVDDSDNVYVTSDHKVQKFAKNGGLMKIIGSDHAGALESQFNHPNGIKFREGHVYVCDSNNGRVQVFTEELVFVRKFGRKGEDKGHFQSPIDIDFDSLQNIYVADVDRHNILVFNKDSVFLRTIGSYGTDSGNLSRPSGVCIAGEFVYVVENFVQRVSVFHVSGAFVCSFGAHGHQMGQLNSPVDIAVDKHGFCFVCDTQNNRIQVF